MNNRQFNVTGVTDEALFKTLQLAFDNEYGSNTCSGWIFEPTHGLLLVEYGNEKDINKFPTPMSSDEVFPFVKKWIKTDEALTVELDGWECDLDHDGHNKLGWRVYVEDWGHVNGRWGILCAVKPIYVWHGKQESFMNKAEMFRERADKIAVSFNNIKQNPLNLNVLYAHVGVISLTLDELLRDYAEILEKENNK